MSVLLTDFFQSVRRTLLDPEPAQTWSDTDLTGFTNRILAQAANLKRDIAPAIVPVPLVAGTVQQLPPNGLAVMNIYYNVASGQVCRQGGLELMNAKFPTWRAGAAGPDVFTWMTDERSPRFFHVNPPNDGTGQVVVLMGTVPSISMVPSAGGVMPLPDEYQWAIHEGVVAMAYAANSRRQDITKATAHYQMFTMALTGSKMAQSEVAAALGQGEEK